MPFLILALDGGGTRVSLQWRMLQRLLERYPSLLGAVDVFAGTSAGAILAAGLACGMGPFIDDILTPANFERIFARRPGRTLGERLAVRGLCRAKYDTEGVQRVLEDHFGAVTLHEVPRPLFIPAFNTRSHEEQQQRGTLRKRSIAPEHLTAPDGPQWMNTRCDRWHSVFYHNLTEPETPERSESLVHALLKSAAAPYYFPMVGHTVDGGVTHNNPSMAALTHLLALGVPLSEIYILSLGTGEKPQQLDAPRNASYGLFQWLPHLIDMFFDANEESTSQSCYEILGDRFWRVNPVLERNIPLDSTSAADLVELQRVANDYALEHTFAWLDKLLA